MYKKPLIQSIDRKTFGSATIAVSALRLDIIHPAVSGNKWYKLKYYLEEAVSSDKKGIISFGGAYSNHLVALAFACKKANIKAIGVVRGEEPASYGPSLLQIKELGMELLFVSREQYKNKNAMGDMLSLTYPEFLIVPEGGAGEPGIKGATEIMDVVQDNFTHIVCAVGTGTTMAGLIRASKKNQQVIGISALKVANENNNELINYIGANTEQNNWEIMFNYHFGGYARYSQNLLLFMNSFFQQENIPTDFVYTGKLFYAVNDLIKENFFPAGSKILIIHSGGLQGNRSIEKGKLIF